LVRGVTHTQKRRTTNIETLTENGTWHTFLHLPKGVQGEDLPPPADEDTTDDTGCGGRHCNTDNFTRHSLHASGPAGPPPCVTEHMNHADSKRTLEINVVHNEETSSCTSSGKRRSSDALTTSVQRLSWQINRCVLTTGTDREQRVLPHP